MSDMKSASPAPSASAGGPTQITLKLHELDSDAGEDLEVRMRTSTKFIRLARTFATRQNRELSELRFIFKGRRILSTSEVPVGDLGLADGDTIEVSPKVMNVYTLGTVLSASGHARGPSVAYRAERADRDRGECRQLATALSSEVMNLHDPLTTRP
ncbi:hypothetical protein GGF31_001168 [Allomyces arbusculus]|nr:hypothetical protein GGF31_001168 [Allomyces arbusculus]